MLMRGNEREYWWKKDEKGVGVMRKVLIFGGSRYFGKRLALRLAEAGDDVTIVTRGQLQVPEAEGIRSIKGDRQSVATMKDLARNEYDLVYDNICFNPYQAKIATDAFMDRVGKYVLTSTMSVYAPEAALKESDFNPLHHEYHLDAEHDYGQGKREAESYFFHRASFPVTTVRLPIVLGPDDYTDRLKFYVDAVRNEEPIVLHHPEALMGFISSFEAAAFLEWVGRADVRGPFNAASDGLISLGALMERIGQHIGKPVQIIKDGESSPYDTDVDYYMSNAEAKKAGFVFTQLDDWIDRVIIQTIRK
ncbi:epimerase [Exiguobacterium sp. SH1S4]|nr:epimerase [Exiguobacterium sp. SH4S7]TCI47899.1 epimerase [Exiguobacterium sp. SH5S32]TCI52311.1 epimerase [Exiguobacterium sp. SH1S21]TCI54783.1 epimerase [Exiguobacterium sp. SH1S4]TCI61634.1 epimerase [Exiguobacterium sp. SH0S2]TCI74579.1 epimerase [Exiguobacterium sp. SH1S1]